MLRSWEGAPIEIVGLFLLSAAVQAFRERRDHNRFPRIFSVVVGIIGIIVAIIQSRHTPLHSEGLAVSPIVTGDQLSYISALVFKGKDISTIVSLALFLGGVCFTPAAPLVRVRMSRVFVMQGLLIGLIQATEVVTFLMLAVGLTLMFILTLALHARSLSEDLRGGLRAMVFRRYQGVALLAMCGSIFLRCGDLFHIVPASPTTVMLDRGFLILAAAIGAGLFPFHGWVVPFLGAPRSTVFLPLMCMETAMIFFLRVYAPLVTQFMGSSLIFLWVPACGLVYASLLFFGEKRLKRIPAYLYMSHINLMAISSIGFGQAGMAVSMLDGVNVLCAVLGLLGVCALLTSRFGVRGVLAPSGLGALFPELGVCYLVCVFSLVGLPGTLGFINEEVMLDQGLQYHSFLVAVIALALTLNGFSSFRLFARIFYGQPFERRDPETALVVRERVVIFLILAVILLNGIAPEFLVRALTRLAS